MQEIQDKFVIKVKQLPDQIDSSSYSKIFLFKFSEIINLKFKSAHINYEINKLDLILIIKILKLLDKLY
jgi:hypothetical protein